MGYWNQNELGESFTGEGIWGDQVADILDSALAEIIKQFTRDVERPPTIGELKSGLLFSLGPLRYKPDSTPHTEENMEAATEELLALHDQYAAEKRGAYAEAAPEGSVPLTLED